MVTSFLEFRSKVDAWMSWTLWGSALLMLAAAAMTLFDAEAGPGTKAVVIFLSLVTIPFVLWVRYDTSYRLTDTHLLVRSGPFRTRVVLDSILSIEPTSSYQSGPTLSRQRFLIRYDRYATVMVSPEDRGPFLDELCLRAPHLVWQDGKLAALS